MTLRLSHCVNMTLAPRCMCSLFRTSAFRLKHSISPALTIYHRNKSNNTVVKSTRSSGELDTEVKPLGEKVKETTKTASYLGVILLGVGVTGTLFYAVFRELFSSNSPNNIYSQAVAKCKEDTRVQDKLGLPITAFGEENKRRRRQHVRHVPYVNQEGRQCLRMRFYLKGTFHQGTVNLEMIQNDSGNYEYRYLFVEVDDMSRSVIILEDNRTRFATPAITTSESLDLTL